MSVVQSELMNEVRMYWLVMNTSLAIVPLSEFRDELEIISMMTDSAVLKETCLRNQDRYKSAGRLALLASAG